MKHEGLSINRLKPEAENPREVVFAKRWRKENDDPSLRRGTLACLLRGGGKEVLTQDEATVAATVVQWLGSPVGFSFLTDVLNEIGLDLVRRGK